jgi:DNA polymerase III delta prime subunit
MSSNKSFSSGQSGQAGKKVFLICVNSMSLDAQNVLLKMFEEPIENTHFFLVVPDANALLKTLISRFSLISARKDLAEEAKVAEKFIAMPLAKRIDYIKELLAEAEEEDEEENEIIALDSTRSKALKFLNALEQVLQSNFLRNSSGFLQPSAGTFPVQNFPKNCFQHFFKVREFLRMPGSSTKSLMESVALMIPEKA